MRPDPDELGPDAEDFGRVVDVLSTMSSEDSWRDQVPGDLWADIESRLATADEPTVLASPAELRVVDPEPVDVTSAPATPVASSAGNVVQLDDRRRQRWFRAAAAAAVVVIAAGTFGVITTNSPDTTQEVVASVDLEPLKERGSGTAELVTIDGVEQLRITADGLGPAPEGYHYEMWLIDADVTDPRSLGRLPSGQDQIVVDVPEGIDLDEYPIVDINVQVDGQEQHSGVETSVLRGSLA
jgi:anti-sigma-K factor RskA